MKNFKYTFFALAGIIMASCATPPEFPIEPFIEFVSLSKDTMLNGTGSDDSVELVFSFTDGDGDIGFPQGDNPPKNILLINRETGDTLLDKFTIPDIPNRGASNGIKGEITVVLLQQCCDFNPPAPGYFCGGNGSIAPVPFDTLNMDIVIIDAAGHVSNRTQASPLILICD